MLKQLKKLCSITIIGLLFTINVTAKPFTNQYCEFQLPPGWDCALEGTEWVCQSSNKNRKKEAIIILAAKIRGAQDDLAKYQAYLKSNKTFTLPGGKTQVSEPKYTKITDISSHKWIDSLHLASEVPGFYTRYLATVKKDLGVAVTFSVGKEYYDAYRPLFDKIVASLKVFRRGNISANDAVQVKRGNDIIGQDDFIDGDGPVAIGQSQRKKKSKSGSSEDSMLYLLLGLVAAGVVVMKLKKGKKGKKKKKKSKK